MTLATLKLVKSCHVQKTLQDKFTSSNPNGLVYHSLLLEKQKQNKTKSKQNKPVLMMYFYRSIRRQQNIQLNVFLISEISCLNIYTYILMDMHMMPQQMYCIRVSVGMNCSAK